MKNVGQTFRAGLPGGGAGLGMVPAPHLSAISLLPADLAAIRREGRVAALMPPPPAGTVQLDRPRAAVRGPGFCLSSAIFRLHFASLGGAPDACAQPD